MMKAVVKVRSDKITIISEQGFEIESIGETILRIGKYVIFLSAKGSGKEIEKIKNAIRETKGMVNYPPPLYGAETLQGVLVDYP